MRNLTSALLLAGTLGLAGCATKSDRPTATTTATAPWQYQTFTINYINDQDYRQQVLDLWRQGWSYVSTSSSGRGAVGGIALVRMRRPAQ